MRVNEVLPTNETQLQVQCWERLDVVVVDGVEDSMFLVVLSVVLRLAVLAALLKLICCSLLPPC